MTTSSKNHIWYELLLELANNLRASHNGLLKRANLPVSNAVASKPIHGIKAPYCTALHRFYLLNARFFGFWRSLVKSLSDWFSFFFF